MCDWTTIGLILTFMGMLSAFIIWSFSKLDGDIKTLSQKLDNDTQLHVQRTDQLYQMFIDLLKEQKAK